MRLFDSLEPWHSEEGRRPGWDRDGSRGTASGTMAPLGKLQGLG